MGIFRSTGVKLSIHAEGESGTKDFQILRVGTFFDSRYGKFDITGDLLSKMVNNHKANVRGVDCALDFAHRSDDVAAGWIKELFLSEDKKELWGTVELTPAGLEAVKSKAFRYISADFDSEFTDNETLKNVGPVLLGAGLTNRPVVKGMKPIELSEHNNLAALVVQCKKEGLSDEQALAKAKELQAKGELSPLDIKPHKGDPLAEQNKKPKGENMDLEQLKAFLESIGIKSIDELKQLISQGKTAGETETQMGKMAGELSETKSKLKEISEQLLSTKKESDFQKLLSEGKAVPAQREPFIKGDVIGFANAAMKLNTSPSGDASVTTLSDSDDSEAKVIKLANEKQKDNPKLERHRAILAARKELGIRT